MLNERIKMQNEFEIQLNTIDKVKRFVKICDSFKEDIDLSSDRYMVDAKSIMGIFSFDLTKPLNVHIHSQDIVTLAKFNEEMSDFKYEH